MYAALSSTFKIQSLGGRHEKLLTHRQGKERHDTRIEDSRSISNRYKLKRYFIALPLLCYRNSAAKSNSFAERTNPTRAADSRKKILDSALNSGMAGLRGKSGPPGNQNAFRHGLAAIHNRRAEGALTENERDIRTEIAGWIADPAAKRR
jgi:hypothetical protein